jgi:hypothetical protein
MKIKEIHMFTKSKTIKLILSLFLAISMVATVACSKDDDKDDSKDSKKTTVASTEKTEKETTKKAEKTEKAKTTKKAETEPVSAGADFSDYDGYWGTTLDDEDYVMYISIDDEDFEIVMVSDQDQYDTGDITFNDDGTITFLNQDDEEAVFEYDSDEDVLLCEDTDEWVRLTQAEAKEALGEEGGSTENPTPTGDMDVIGTWIISEETFLEVLRSLGITEEMLQAEEFSGLNELVEVSLTFKANNVCYLVSEGVTETAEWEYAGAGVNIIMDNGEEWYLTYTPEGTLSINDEGIILAFEKTE